MTDTIGDATRVQWLPHSTETVTLCVCVIHRWWLWCHDTHGQLVYL